MHGKDSRDDMEVGGKSLRELVHQARERVLQGARERVFRHNGADLAQLETSLENISALQVDLGPGELKNRQLHLTEPVEGIRPELVALALNNIECGGYDSPHVIDTTVERILLKIRNS